MAKVADIVAEDRGEDVSAIEPLLLGEKNKAALVDRALELARKSASLRASLPPYLDASLAELVRGMNCYYSNLIEGHDTHPVQIERALRDDYSSDATKRDLQLEAKAHITVQRWIDNGGLRERSAFAPESITEIHRRFCEVLPPELLVVEDPETKTTVTVIPGKFRSRDVRVGNHISVSPGALPRFIARFAEAYSGLGKTDSLIAAAAAHHRLVWIHPFVDGNGRVVRLMSHAVLLNLLDTGALWSVARGLARNAQQYKRLLANCDLPRRNDLDGRGNLSEEALAEFTKFFLDVCIDQVTFMESLMQPDHLRTRILLWAEEEVRLGNLPPKSGSVLEAILYRGELPRNEVAGIVGTGDRQARRIISAISEKGVLSSDTSRSALRLNFPAALASRWMPGLFPGEPDDK